MRRKKIRLRHLAALMFVTMCRDGIARCAAQKKRLRRLVSLVFVAVCRDCIACACQSNLISTLGHYTVASLYTS